MSTKCIKNKNKGGYIVLLSVLFVGAIATTVTISVLLLGIGGLRNGFDISQSYQAKALADLCAEEALEIIRESTPFAGTDTLIIGPGQCTYSVINAGGNNRIIESEGRVNEVYRRLIIEISSINPNIIIDSWQEGIF